MASIFKILKIRKRPKEEKITTPPTKESIEKTLPENLVMKDFYSIKKPYAHVGIMIEKETGKLIYYVIEPMLDEEETKALNFIREIIRNEDVNIPLDMLKDRKSIETYLKKRTREIAKTYKLNLSKDRLNKIIYYIIRDSIGYGKLDVIINDEMVEDISCDGANIPVYVWHRNYESMPTNIIFKTIDELESYVVRLVSISGQQISVARPVAEGMLPEGFRLHALLSDISRKGPSFTIRKFFVEPLTIIDLVKSGTISPELAGYFWLLIEHKRPIFIAGAMASGKTTLLNTLLSFVRPEMKIVTIEETPELNLVHENWVSLVIRPAYQTGVQEVALFDLLKASLRMRPDYIVVGEVRGEEAYTFFQAIAVGHGGLCTIHADNIDSVIKRLLSKPMEIPPQLIPMINSLVLMGRLKRGDTIIRRVLDVEEIEGMSEKNEAILNQAFKYNMRDDTIIFTNKSVIIEKIAKFLQIDSSILFEEIRKRASIIEWMANNNLRKKEDVAKVIRTYYTKPDLIMEHVRLNLKTLTL
jgi:flagellar protein FlaI